MWPSWRGGQIILVVRVISESGRRRPGRRCRQNLVEPGAKSSRLRRLVVACTRVTVRTRGVQLEVLTSAPQHRSRRPRHRRWARWQAHWPLRVLWRAGGGWRARARVFVSVLSYILRHQRACVRAQAALARGVAGRRGGRAWCGHFGACARTCACRRALSLALSPSLSLCRSAVGGRGEVAAVGSDPCACWLAC
jgi:hypothetical protein